MSATNATVPALSDYEKNRALNIERNNARLRELGLISEEEEKISNDLAWKRKNTEANAKSVSSESSSKDVQKKRKRNDALKQPVEPSRKSLRVQGKNPEAAPTTDETNNASFDEGEPLHSKRERWVEECRKARQLAAVRYAELTDAEKKAAKENPKATYEHCLKRVRTMNEKGLYNRVRAIERAAGKHCVIKMAIFRSCLQDENMWELAAAASEALERLKALQPPAE